MRELDVEKEGKKKIDTFELWTWRRLLKVPWTAKRTNQSILDEVRPECSLEAFMLKQKLSYFGHVMRAERSLEKTIMLGKVGGRRRRGRQRTRWMDGIREGTGMSLQQLRDIVKDRSTWRELIHGVTRSRRRLDGTEQQQIIQKYDYYLITDYIGIIFLDYYSILFNLLRLRKSQNMMKMMIITEKSGP